jgi:hypothetical protein
MIECSLLGLYEHCNHSKYIKNIPHIIKTYEFLYEEDEDFNERPSPSRRVFQERKEFLDDPRFRERQPAEPRRPSLYDRRKPVDRRRLPEP